MLSMRKRKLSKATRKKGGVFGNWLLSKQNWIRSTTAVNPKDIIAFGSFEYHTRGFTRHKLFCICKTSENKLLVYCRSMPWKWLSLFLTLLKAATPALNLSGMLTIFGVLSANFYSGTGYFLMSAGAVGGGLYFAAPFFIAAFATYYAHKVGKHAFGTKNAVTHSNELKEVKEVKEVHLNKIKTMLSNYDIFKNWYAVSSESYENIICRVNDPLASFPTNHPEKKNAIVHPTANYYQDKVVWMKCVEKCDQLVSSEESNYTDKFANVNINDFRNKIRTVSQQEAKSEAPAAPARRRSAPAAPARRRSAPAAPAAPARRRSSRRRSSDRRRTSTPPLLHSSTLPLFQPSEM